MFEQKLNCGHGICAMLRCFTPELDRWNEVFHRARAKVARTCPLCDHVCDLLDARKSAHCVRTQIMRMKPDVEDLACAQAVELFSDPVTMERPRGCGQVQAQK